MDEIKIYGIAEIYFKEWATRIDAEDYMQASLIDVAYYQREVRCTENSQSWRIWYDMTKERRSLVNRKLTELYPFKEVGSPVNNVKKNIAFVYDQFSGLAHEQVTARNIEYINNNVREFKAYIVYAFGSSNEKHAIEASKLYNINIENILFLESKSYIDVGLQMNARFDTLDLQTIIYASTFEMAFWASLYCTHPRQKYRIMKYYPPRVGRFCEFAGGRINNEDYLKINGEMYLQLSPMVFNLIGQTETSKPIAHQSPIIFGSVSRIQKSINFDYQKFILKLLNIRDDVAYFYTGKMEEIDLLASELTGHERAFFLGWVEPVRAIQNISIYLETFPWGGGDMTLLALSLGKPYLTLMSNENMEFGICRTILFIANHAESKDDRGIVNYSFCKSTDEMMYKFNELCNSKEMREKLGFAWKKVITEYKPTLINTWINFIFN